MAELARAARKRDRADGMIGIAILRNWVVDSRPDLLGRNSTAAQFPRGGDRHEAMFAAIRSKTCCCTTAYETFRTWSVRFLAQAARDLMWWRIKQTL